MMNNHPAWYYSGTMRLIDLAVALFIFVALSWLLVIIYIWINLESKGPAIFSQERVGLDGKLFTCYKFRSMYIDTDQAASHLISSSQVTRSGRFLRACKLDELPQAWNLLINDMALVGPRPCLPTQEELIRERKIEDVLSVKPGITGLSQIRNIDMSDPLKLAKSDAQYLAMRSVSQDLKIIVKTVLGRGQGDKVKSAS